MDLSARQPAEPEEAAAIAAAIERFLADTLRPAPAAQAAPVGWARAALSEGVRREPGPDVPHPWINT